jgi:hypothetical protein
VLFERRTFPTRTEAQDYADHFNRAHLPSARSYLTGYVSPYVVERIKHGRDCGQWTVVDLSVVRRGISPW